jgi:RimJ/RimL family protein N-acetyltransferase
MVELNVYTYVFDVLKLNKLCCEVFCSNDLVIKIHEKYGSKIEGTLKQHILKNGQFHDIVTMGILKSEWEASPLRGTVEPAVIDS